MVEEAHKDSFGTPYLKLNSGHMIPLIGFGTAVFDKDGLNPGDHRALVDVLKNAIKTGYRMIDTAWLYGCEPMIADAIKESIAEGVIKREDMFIITKLWHTKKEDVEGACRESLTNLGLDYIDLYLLHWTTPYVTMPYETGKMIPLEKTWADMEQLVDKGIVKSIGLSNSTVLTTANIHAGARIKPALN